MSAKDLEQLIREALIRGGVRAGDVYFGRYGVTVSEAVWNDVWNCSIDLPMPIKGIPRPGDEALAQQMVDEVLMARESMLARGSDG